MPTFNIEKAREAGYNDEEIGKFLEESHPRFDRKKALESGYDEREINAYLSSPEAQQKASDFSEAVPRAIAQVPLGLAETTTPGLLASGLKLAGQGEALSALEDELSPERIADLRQKFPGFNIPDVDREKYLKSVEEAASSFPTVENISKFIEEKTGIPITPKSELDNSIRFIANVGGFGNGGPAQRLFSGMKAETARRFLDEAAVPEPISDALSLYYGLRSKTPKPTTVLKEMEESKAASRLKKESRKGEELVPETPALFEKDQQEFERLGKMISPKRFETDAKAGRTISELVKDQFKKAKEDYTQKYAKARETTIGRKDIFPSLAVKVEEAIESLKESVSPSAAEKTVLSQLRDLQGLIGTNSGLIEAPLNRLIKTADSIASSLKYEIPDPGVKNILKSFVKDINEQVIASLERQGVASHWMKDADRAYAKAADLYFSDELSPFLAKTIRDPESLARLAKNPGTFRALKEAIGTKHKNAMKALERNLTEAIVTKYIERPAEIFGLEFEDDMRRLSELIGPKALEVRNALFDRAKTKRAIKSVIELAKSVGGLFGVGKAVSLSSKIGSIAKDTGR